MSPLRKNFPLKKLLRFFFENSFEVLNSIKSAVDAGQGRDEDILEAEESIEDDLCKLIYDIKTSKRYQMVHKS